MCISCGNCPPASSGPRPQVESAIVSYQRDSAKAAEIHDMTTFRQIIALFMSHRRKMLKACTKFTDGRLEQIRRWNDIFDEAFVDAHKRPEEITPKQYINIANLCYEQVRK